MKRFLERRLSFGDCIAALDAALAGLIRTLTGEQILRVRIKMLRAEYKKAREDLQQQMREHGC
jgi:hypothetical protein